MSALYRRENLLATICALIRFAVCCYRAVHQSVTIDEASTYMQFVDGPWRLLFGHFDANNHVLSSILIKLTIKIAGLSEFTLRFPSLVSGFFLVLGSFWLLKRVESPLIRWTAFAVVCLDPVLMDFSIAARGYSLSLALFVWGLYFCLERRYLLAGVLLGLSIAANLAILFPILALICIIALFERQEKPLLYLIVPTFLVAALISGPTLRQAHREDFYSGYAELAHAVDSYLATSLYPRPDRDGFLHGREHIIPPLILALPFLLAFLAGASLFVRDRRKLIPFLTLVLTLIGLQLAHWLFGVVYPADRACLYFAVLIAVSWAITADAFKNRFAQVLWLLPLIVVVVQFSTQLQTRYFEFWQPEENDKLISELIKRDAEGKPANSLTVSSSFIHQPSLEFYRRYLHIAALKPIERTDPPPVTGFDFYVLSQGDADKAKRGNLRVVFENQEAHVILAEP